MAYVHECHACGLPIPPFAGCVCRFGDDGLRYYHTACKPAPGVVCQACGEPVSQLSMLRTVEHGKVVTRHVGCVQAEIIPGVEMGDAV